MKYTTILILAIIAYMIGVWGNGLDDKITDLRDKQKERNEKIEKILKGE